MTHDIVQCGRITMTIDLQITKISKDYIFYNLKLIKKFQ